MAQNIPAPKILTTEYNGWPGGYQDSNPPDLTPPDAISGGLNVNLKSFPSVSIRGGSYARSGGDSGGSTIFTGDQPTQYFGAIYTNSSSSTIFSVAGGQPYRHASTNTAPTLSTNVFTDTTTPTSVWVAPNSGSVYFTNGTDAVIKWGSSGADSTPASFKKGKVGCFWRGRHIVANLNSAGNYNIVWFSDEYADTFTSTNYAYIGDLDVTAVFVHNDALYVGNKREVFRINNLVFTAATGLTFDNVQKLPAVSQGPINQNSIASVGNFSFWLGSDGVFMFNGYTSINVSLDKIQTTWKSIDTNTLPTTGCGIGALGRYYFAVPIGTEGNQSYNNRILYFDPRNVQSNPYSITAQGVFSAPYDLYAGGFAYQMANDPSAYSLFGSATSGASRASLFYMDSRYSAFFEMELDQTAGFDQYKTGLDWSAASINVAATQTFNTDNQVSAVSGTKLALKFVPTVAMTGVRVVVMPRIKRVSGTAGQVVFQFYTDTAGLPSNTPVGGAYNYTLASPDTSYQSLSYLLTQTMTANTTYWLVMDITGIGGTAVYAWNGKSGATSGTSATYNGSSWSAGTQSLGCVILTSSNLTNAYFETNAAQFGAPHFKKKMKRGFVRGQRNQSSGTQTTTINLKYKDSINGTYVTETLSDPSSQIAAAGNYGFEGYVKDRTKAKSIVTRIDVTQTGGIDWQIDQLVNAATLLPRFK